jgi:hypothetical protein
MGFVGHHTTQLGARWGTEKGFFSKRVVEFERKQGCLASTRENNAIWLP